MAKRKKVGAINLLFKNNKLLEKNRTFIRKLVEKVPWTRLNTVSKKIGFFSTQVKDLVIKKSKIDIIKE